MSEVTAGQVIRALAYWVSSFERSLILPNVYPLGSPWECDLIKVSKAFYYREYEVKLSIEDYAADFRKRIRSWSAARRKHDIYASKEIQLYNRKPITKPKYFCFVTPLGMIDTDDVAKHCGHITFEQTDRGLRFKWGRKPPVLPHATKLSPEAIYNLAIKASSKVFHS